MAKVSLIQTNFTAGELSPLMKGRVDISRYHNGAQRIENALIAVQGGLMRTWGTKFIAHAKYDDKKSRLIPYVFNREQAYIVEFGDKYCRIYKDGQYQAEIESPYTEEMLFKLNYVQGADTMFLAHMSVPVHRLRRVSDTEWTLSKAPFIVEPYDEVGEYPDFTINLTEYEAGKEATATVYKGDDISTLGSFWLDADVGRTITSGTGIAEITAVTSASVAKVKIITSFKEYWIWNGNWHLEGSPLTTIKPTNGAEGTATEGDITVGDEVTLTLTNNGWRATDVGKYVKIYKGLYQITTVSSAKAVKAQCITAPETKASAIAWGWSLMSSVWNERFGYPSAITLCEQRLFCGGTANNPQTIWMSKVGEYLNFQISTENADAGSFTMSSDQINPVVHLTQATVPIILTYGGEFSLVSAATQAAITPESTGIRNHSTYGCNSVRPVRIGTEVFYMQRAGTKLLAMGFSAADDSFLSQNVTVLSEHITKTGIVDMAYQQEPYSILWLVRADGQIATMTIDKDQEVIGWSRQITDGYFESVATIPSDDGSIDEMWCVVRREVNGNTVRYIEQFNRDIYSHSAKSYEHQTAIDTYNELEHLEGKEVAVLADGVPLQSRTVKNGSITLERKANSVVIGLPYKTLVETLDIEIQGAVGTAQGNQKRIGETVLRLFETTGCKVNGDDTAFRQAGIGILDKPPVKFTGDKRTENLGWNNTITIEQDQPLPFTLLAVIRKVTVND